MAKKPIWKLVKWYVIAAIVLAGLVQCVQSLNSTDIKPPPQKTVAPPNPTPAAETQATAKPAASTPEPASTTVIDHPTFVVEPTKPTTPRPVYAPGGRPLSGAIAPEEAALNAEWDAWDQYECTEATFKKSFADYKTVRLLHLKAYLHEFDLMSGGNSSSNLREKLEFQRGRNKLLLPKLEHSVPACVAKRKPPPAIVADFRPMYASFSEWVRKSSELAVTDNARVYKTPTEEAFAETKFHVQTIEHYFGIAAAPKKPKHLL